MTDETKVCLDLFSGLGGFSAAFERAHEWQVTTVDIEPDFDPDLCADVMDLRPRDLFDAIGYERDEIDTLVVLASPPCTQLSIAGNHDAWDFESHEPLTNAARESILIVYHTIGLVHAIAPEYWYLENPRGRLRWYLPTPTGEVTYCQYGTDYQKPTDLWGNHAPMRYRRCSPGSPCHETCGRDDDDSGALSNQQRDPAKRALVPAELSKAILDAVEDAIENPPPEQTTLATVGGGQ